MLELLKQIISHPIASIVVIGNLILIECLLSVDNAAVIATMVKDLPVALKKKALRYGILGAYVFRGLAICFASMLINIWWLKPLGGLYLIYLVGKWFTRNRKLLDNKAQVKNKERSQSVLFKLFGEFWATVILVEIMDIAFSIDNVFAAVAFSQNILLVCTGIFIGMLAMRLVAQWFVNLMEQFPFLETSAFIVIGILGIKLMLSLLQHFIPASAISMLLSGSGADIATSVITITIFVVPVFWHILFRHKVIKQDVNKRKHM